MIRFSARSAYLFLVAQGGALIFRTGRLFLSGETSKCSKQNFNVVFINRNCNSNKYTVNVQLTHVREF